MSGAAIHRSYHKKTNFFRQSYHISGTPNWRSSTHSAKLKDPSINMESISVQDKSDSRKNTVPAGTIASGKVIT